MRLLVFLLIFANLIFFAYARGYLGGESVSEAGRLEAQIQPERLHLMWRPGNEPEDAYKVSLPENDNEANGAENATGDETSENAQADSIPSPNVVAATETACLTVSLLGVQAADEVETKAGTAKLEMRRRSEGSWWVFIPPQGSKEGADKKASELLQFGVKDFFIVSDGPQKFAISLGVFSQEEGARRHLEALRGKNVRSARAEARHPENIRTTLEIRGRADEIAALRDQLPAEAQTRACSKP
ncbi:MAG: hypothetical protein FWG81_10790 [Betaproteobacteria bacterium]|nr:hypothetical protein [Betaproteobacteria bacterium]